MAIKVHAIDNVLNDAQIVRQAIGSLVSSAGGVTAPGGLSLAQKGTPNMSVIVNGGNTAEGGCWVPGFNESSGPYFFYNSADFECLIAASGATFARVDTVVARVLDKSVEGVGEEGKIEALKGAEESGVTLANKKGAVVVPKGCLVLGYVLVPATAVSIVTADISNNAGVASGGVPPLGEVAIVANYTAKRGDMVEALGGSNLTVTLPTPSASSMLAVSNLLNSETGTVTINAGTAKIYGDAVSGETSIVLGYHQHVLLFADGTNWIILGGQPKPTSTYSAFVARAGGAPFEPSPSRPTFVVLRFQVTGGESTEKTKFGGMTVDVGTQTIANVTLTTNSINTEQQSFSFIVPPGETWKAFLNAFAVQLESSYLFL